MSDLGVISPLRASGAMYAVVPTILSVITVEHECLPEARVKPKSEILGTKWWSNKMFALSDRCSGVGITTMLFCISSSRVRCVSQTSLHHDGCDYCNAGTSDPVLFPWRWNTSSARREKDSHPAGNVEGSLKHGEVELKEFTGSFITRHPSRSSRDPLGMKA